MESKTERTVCEYSEKNGWINFKFKSTSKGVPDRIFIGYGITVYIEFKDKGKKLRPLQKVICDKIKSKGVPMYTVDNINEGIKILNKYAKRK